MSSMHMCGVGLAADSLAYRQIALLKMYATQGSHKTAEDAVQIFGGRGITRTGMGRQIEHVSPTLFNSVSISLNPIMLLAH